MINCILSGALIREGALYLGVVTNCKSISKVLDEGGMCDKGFGSVAQLLSLKYIYDGVHLGEVFSH